MYNHDWNKCSSIINRLRSRANDDSNGRMMGSHNSMMAGSEIEASFYECENNLGQRRCVQLSNDLAKPLRCQSNRRTCVENFTMKQDCCPTLNNCDGNSNFPFSRNQFVGKRESSRQALSNMFDTKRKSIDYIVTNVLRQVVRHVSVETLHQLSCCLPQNVEEILRYVTGIDSDRLVRILVTEVLQCYGTNASHVFDWYAFASSVRSLPLATSPIETKAMHDEIPIKSSEQASDRLPRNQKNDETETSQKNSKTTAMTDSKEKFIPTGAKFPAKIKIQQNKVESTQNEENAVKSTSDHSLNSESIVTIQHKHGLGQKYQHRKIHTHHRQQNHHHTTTSFDSPLSDHQLDSMKSTDDFPALDQTFGDDRDQSNSFELWPLSSHTSSEAINAPVFQDDDTTTTEK